MVGAGQLARMTLPAAIALDVRLGVLAATPDDPAVRAGAPAIVGAPDDLAALRRLAARAAVVTFDHEVVPPEHLRALEAEGAVLRPAAAANLHAQDKGHQRAALARWGLPVPPWALCGDGGALRAFGEVAGWPVVAKAPRGGYDGRGVAVLDAAAAAAWQTFPVLAEQRVPFTRELAVLVARRPGGAAVAYPVVETVQVDGMLREARAPAPRARDAVPLALAVAEAVDAVGILAVELFDAPGGLLVNELALRPHNSGHGTIEGCATSQFENHLRAVLDLPLGATDLRAPAVATVNVVGGDPRARRAAALAVGGAAVHLYGKAPRPGRKLGHVTALGPDLPAALATARAAAAVLTADAGPGADAAGPGAAGGGARE